MSRAQPGSRRAGTLAPLLGAAGEGENIAVVLGKERQLFLWG